MMCWLMLFVRKKKSAAGGLDGWGWKELKALLPPWFDGLARILRLVEETGVWPDGLLGFWFPQLLFFSVSLILLLGVLVFLLTLLGLMKNSARLGFPTFVVLGKGRPALMNSIVSVMGGCRIWRSFFASFDWGYVI